MTSGPDDAARLLGAGALGDALDRLVDAARPSGILDGWGTVDLDRAEVELSGVTAAHAAGNGRGAPAAAPAPPERILGAACRLLHWPDGGAVLLLEPSTEGRLAAALARHGEGFIARYLVADSGVAERIRRAGFGVSTEASGPLGRERLVLVGPRDGPFVILAGLE